MRFGMWMMCVALVGGCSGPGDPSGGPAYEGRWAGTLETGFLPSGASSVVLELDRAQTGEPVMARVVFGEGEAPAPPTDAEVGWPTEVDPLRAQTIPVADGFEYEAFGGARTDDRVRIDLAVTALWEPWCAMQTAHQISAGADDALCLPNRPWTATPFECHLDADETNPEEPVDCLKLTLCRRVHVCDCTTDGCEPSANGLTLTLDLLFDGNGATGSFVWNSEGASGTARVSLTRQ